jgi:1-acyl-sn-glycerol-3-phosphate acyltransferase
MSEQSHAELAGEAGQATKDLRLWQWLIFLVGRNLIVALGRLYFPGRVRGRENLPTSGSYILAPVHRSYVDWAILARVTPRRLRYVTKASVFRPRLFGALLEVLGGFPVNRDGADREAFNRSLVVLDNDEPLVLFPEGTRRSGPEVAPLKEGAAYLALRTGAPIVPVALAHSEAAMPRGSRFPRPRRVDIVIGPPLEVTGEQKAGVKGEREVSGVTGVRQRVRRSAARTLTEELRKSLQSLFDEAEGRAGPSRLGSGG